MSPEATLVEHLVASDVAFRLINHKACRTSIESAAARAAGGAPGAVGAKALIISTKGSFVMVVLPGMRQLDSKYARKLIGKFRFARPEEVLDVTDGLEIGTIPPFARPVLPGIGKLVVDRRVIESDTIGFNAACLTRSVVMLGADYNFAAQPDVVDDISVDHETDT